ncbi:ABC transporter permease [Secundilactobacillus paracollinoides]|uniref:ABC transporter permease n=1 Tax=Secundilactobacillus paracollinoides TaxID=240427 RepID=A0A1B2J268_9LACO|nr:ABC transporter permease [Secundilactobacillus paracollinoides]ANZ62423.1 ABC transporter permease [Secundilactobacillus paracollinoides]ANZ64798.1 ABC transporter permease [Secundilactobacillus paracollinoides]ANZ68373.1 ABC transporter permease [Secundilactobacillus paracollinoides]
MRKLWLVTVNTYLRQVKSWSFLILVLSPFVMIGLSFGIGWISANSASSGDQIAVVSNQPALRAAYLKTTSKADVKQSITTVAEAKQAQKTEKIQGYLVLTGGQQLKAVYHGSQALSSTRKAKLTTFLTNMQTQQNVAQAKLTKRQVVTLQQQPVVQQRVTSSLGLKKTAKMASFWILVFMVYMILTTYSSITAQEIASEKGTKIMEIIFSSTTALKYFLGKIFGVLLMIVTQLVVYVLGGWASLTAAQHFSATREMYHTYHGLINQVVGNLMSINLVFLFVGVILYTVLAAFCGALVAKPEDSSKAGYLAVYLSMITFFATFPFQSNADALFVRIMSYIPFFSSYFMPMRIINGTATTLQISVSMLILLATLLGMTWYIGRIYGGLMLQTDDGSFWKRLRRGLAN